MLKAQDIVVLLKILSTMTLSKTYPHDLLSQSELATRLCMSASEVNGAIRRLYQSGLLGNTNKSELKSRFPRHLIMLPIKAACEELLVHGVKYFFPVQTLTEATRGIVTSYGAPVFGKKIIHNESDAPVWPYAEGTQYGVALEPLYPSVPKSIVRYPDPLFYDLLALLDAIRSGRARERNLAVKLLREKLNVED